MFKNVKALALALIFAVSLSTAAAAEENAPDSIVLSWTGDTSATQTFAWRDTVEQAEYVQYVPQTQYEKTGFDGAAQAAAADRDISLDCSGIWHYEATAVSLKAATVYRYRVGSENGWSETETFTTSNPGSDSLSFVYMGDIQINSSMTEEYALWGKLAKAAYAKAPDLAFGLLGGDIVESGISTAQLDCFLENAAEVFGSIPLMPANGNHESNFIGGKPELYLDTFALPQNGPAGFSEEFYSFDCANCHILVLNSWVFSGEQALRDEDFAAISNWIAGDLAASNADWQVVVTHIPVYSVHSDTTADAVKKYWAPLFEKYGVDLVFEGHQHVYSRSYPMYEGQIDYSNGITYIMGNSGQKFYDSADERYSERTVYGVPTYQLVNADGDALTVQTFDAGGNELDYCCVAQRASSARLPSFTDIEDGIWYETAAGFVSAGGIMFGTSDTLFSPDAELSRGMLATILWRLAGSSEVDSGSAFTDLSPGTWCYDAVGWASAGGIMNGYGNGAFGMEDPVTREQVASVLYRYAGSPATKQSGQPLGGYRDYSSVAAWALDAVEWAAGEGIVNGSDGLLCPQAGATRAQAAKMLMRFIID